jgi:hypothetical protein
VKNQDLAGSLSSAAAATSAAAPAAARVAVPAAVGAPPVPLERALQLVHLLLCCRHAGADPVGAAFILSCISCNSRCVCSQAGRQGSRANIRRAVGASLACAAAVDGSGGSAYGRQSALTNVLASPAVGSIAVVCSRCLSMDRLACRQRGVVPVGGSDNGMAQWRRR